MTYMEISIHLKNIFKNIKYQICSQYFIIQVTWVYVSYV